MVPSRLGHPLSEMGGSTASRIDICTDLPDLSLLGGLPRLRTPREKEGLADHIVISPVCALGPLVSLLRCHCQPPALGTCVLSE